MRFRTFILAVALAATSLSLRAQQVSYVLDLKAGYNSIANPIDVGSNTVEELFPNMPDGSILAKFNQAGGAWTLNNFDGADGHWGFNGGFSGSLQPGEGAFLYVPVNMQIAFLGEKRQAANPPDAGFGYNLVGCAGLDPCKFEQLLGFSPRPGDILYQYDQPVADPPGSPQQGATSIHHYGTNGWDVIPIVPAARGVFVFLASQSRVLVTPARLQVPAGGAAQFQAQIIGSETGAFQWRFNGNILTGETNQALTLTNVQPSRAGNYSVVVQFASGSVTSINARLSIAVLPVITQPPQSLVVTQGGVAVFTALAEGSAPLFYQWFRAGTPTPLFSGVDRTNFVIPNVPLTASGTYFVRVTNAAGSVTSVTAGLNVLVPPRIVTQPQGAMLAANDNITLTVTAAGTQPLAYQWLLNGNLIPGATGPSLTINSFRADQSGVYRVIVSNVAGAALSDEAILLITGSDAPLSDTFPGSAVISAPIGLLQAVNVGATLEAGEPRHAGKIGGRSIWVNYSSSVAGIVTFRTRGSTFDTLLAAYIGNDLNALSEVASDDDSGGYLSSLITFSVLPGAVYRIVLDGHSGAEGKIILGWNFESTADRVPVFATQPKTQVAVPGGDATFASAIQGPVSDFQWYFNNAPIPGATQPSLTITNVQVTDVGPYFVRARLGSRFADSRMADLELRELDGTGQPPLLRAYDKWEDLLAALAGDPPGLRFNPASQVLGFTGSETFSTAGSGGQNGEPIHCGVVGGHSKWYAYIPPASGRLFLNTDGSNFDTLLAAYTGCCTFATLSPVACDNNAGTNGVTSSMSFNATSNTVYYIAVDGVAGVTGAAKLNYRLLVPMMLTNLASTTNSLTFRLNATPAWPFNVQRSTNCLNWSNILNGTSSSGIYIFTDTNLPPGRRFYRSMQQP
ncbi:MAG: hypothetical protein QOF48_2140 [Verrucomicrobiota bacterium]|jgi:hypothetical protein